MKTAQNHLSSDGIDRRPLTFSECELRVTQAEGKPPVLTGYAVRYNAWSDPLWPNGPRERFLPGAFTDWLATEPDVRALIGHDPNLIMGRTVAGTVSLRETKQGLAFEVIPPDTTYARDLLASIGRGDVRGMSFGFSLADPEKDQQREVDSKGNEKWTVARAKVHEITFTAFPAYPQTSVGLRDSRKACAEREDNEWQRVLTLQRLQLDLMGME